MISTKKILYTILYITCFKATLYCTTQEQTIPEPYKSIKPLALHLKGWFNEENKSCLLRFITETQPKVIVEVGSWLGLSASFMAHQMPDNGILYAVDHWLGDNDIKGEEDVAKLPTLYQQFLSNIIHLKLTHKIVPIRMESTQAAKTFDKKADLIYIDGSHQEEDVYNDIMAWHTHLGKYGIMCGDDFHASSVQNGVRRAAKKLNQTVKALNVFWWFEPKF